MSTKLRTNRKASDADIITLNSVGLSLNSVGHALGVHPTSVTIRLKALNIPPADTRRAFMEDIFFALTPQQQEFLANQVAGTKTIKEYVKELIIAHYNDYHPVVLPAPAAEVTDE